MSDNRYYISSFAWTTISKVLSALVGFVSVPLLLGVYGKADYGLLAIATACNSYMHLLDLGMNTGSVRFYSILRKQGEDKKVLDIIHSNITFYLVIALINALLLCGLAVWGEPLFAVTHEQFATLRACLFILAGFSVLNWNTTVWNQVLVADKQMAFTMQMQTIQALLKGLLVVLVLVTKLSLTMYFLLLTAVLAGLVVPYAIKVRKDGLVDSFVPGWNWESFKPVALFSLSIFALSLFQMTATESRVIVLSIFSLDGADTAADFRVLSVVPSLIIMIGTSFSAIFLPRSSELVAKNDSEGMRRFCYKWTGYTTIIANVLCFPFMLCAREVLAAYVGESFAGLAPWLILWCVTALVQIHTTPANSLVVASGKMKALVWTTAISCLLSIVINALLCRRFGAGSAVIGYFIYVLIVIGLYYLWYYKKLLDLGRLKMLSRFLIPTLVAVVCAIPAWFVPVSTDWFGAINIRLAYIFVCIIRTLIWILPYAGLLFLFRILTPQDLKDMRN